MALNLLDSFGARGVNYGLYTKSADVTDSEYLSRYFVVSEFDPTFTAGKNAVAVNGSTYLKGGSEIFIECLDSVGNPLFIEMATYADTAAKTAAYKESTAFIFSIYVYNDTSDGIGKLTLYGTLNDGRSVKWTRNITINKTLKNDSRVRFYRAPKLEVDSAQVPVLSSTISTGLIDNKTFTGQIQGLAVTPQKGISLATLNKRNVDIDYRLTLISPVVTDSTPNINSFNSQMLGATVVLNITRIQSPTSFDEIDVSQTASYLISGVVNNNTLQIALPYYYKDSFNNDTITNIVNANFAIHYPFVNYNNSTSSYQTSTIGGTTYIIKQSYADITYRNIRTFSGYAARHKVYRKSLLSNADFSVIADEPITVNEILADDLTQNKFYTRLGQFYNQEHVNRYWFTSSGSTNLLMTYSPSYAANSVFISTPSSSYTALTGSDYLMVKNDSVPVNRNATYVPFNMDEFLSESGSAYDSNFMALKAGVQYVIEVSATVIKQPTETNAGLAFYFTGSVSDISKEPAYTGQFGVNVANINATNNGNSIVNFDKVLTFFTPQNDLYGTLVIVPKLCNAYIKDISFRVYGDDGFSPDVFTTRIPWSISVANESFEIVSQLFDINSNLIYSDLKTFQSFDPSGSTLIPFLPAGSNNYQDLYVSGTLYVSQSAIIQFGNLFIPNIVARPGNPDISQSRMLSVRADGALVFDPIVDVSSDNTYMYLSLGSPSSRLSTVITTTKALVSQYGDLAGRKIYWVAGVKTIETSP